MWVRPLSANYLRILSCCSCCWQMLPELLWEKNKISSHLACWQPSLPAKSFLKKKKTPFQSVLQLCKLHHQDSRLLLSPELSPAMHSTGGQTFHITSSFLYDYWQTFNTESVCSKFTSDLDLNLNFVPHQKLWKRQKTHTKKGRRRRDWIEPITPKGQTKWILSLDVRDFWERFKTWQIGTTMMYFD